MADERERRCLRHGHYTAGLPRCPGCFEDNDNLIAQLRAQVAALQGALDHLSKNALTYVGERERLEREVASWSMREVGWLMDRDRLTKELAIARSQRDEQSTLRLHVIERAEKAERFLRRYHDHWDSEAENDCAVFLERIDKVKP